MVLLWPALLVALSVIVIVEDVGNNANTYLLVGWSGMASLASALFGGVGIAKFVKERETVGYLVDGASV